MTITMVRKKDGTLEVFQISKVLNACQLAARNVCKELTEEQKALISSRMGIQFSSDYPVPREKIHKACIKLLKEIDPEISESYRSFRTYKKNEEGMLYADYKELQNLKFNGDRENANFNSALFSTQNAILRGWHSKRIAEAHILDKQEREAHKKGFIYIHDLRDVATGNHNCCVFDMDAVLTNGFKILNVRSKEPNTVNSCCQCMFDIINTASAQQFGGFTVPEIDKIIAKYAMKEYMNGTNIHAIMESIKQGCQSLQHHINANVSARGDTPFITFTFGNFDYNGKYDEIFTDFQYMVCDALMRYRIEVEMTFPKLVMFNSKYYEITFPELYELAAQCVASTLYPDFVSLDEGESGKLFKEKGWAWSPMGCRSFPSPSKNGVVGLFNVGVVSLNLPLIYGACENKENFREDVIKYTKLCFKYLDKRYEQVSKQKCSCNPLMFCEGGCQGGNKRPDELVGDIVNNMGASLGVTALNELAVLKFRKPLHKLETKELDWIKDIVITLNSLCEEYSSDTRHYTLYGTPAESLCGTQCKQFKEMFGNVQGVTDKAYFTNSFHMPVTAEISTIEKMELEAWFFHMFKGGHIQYVRADENSNIEGILDLIRLGREYGFYHGINTYVFVCDDCGEHYRKDPGTHCPKCHHRISKIGRVCGYKGDLRRMNDAKQEEIEQRKSM